MNPWEQNLLAGRYQILEKLGQGGMGEVYKGMDTQSRSHVAIKQLRSGISHEATILERFRREGQALSDLNHPNIVKMLDMIQEEDEYFLVIEFIAGGDLATMLKQQGKLPLKEALRIGLELADALSRAHHLGIIHRDIKPANVLMAADGTPRLTDFGVAHVKSEEPLTGTGVAVGTLDYLPPEAVNGELVDSRADVWAFGVLLYEMMTGQRPFQGTTTIQLLSNILQAPAPDIREHCPEASPALNSLIHQMLEKDRNQRPRSMRQIGAALEAILEGQEPALPNSGNPLSNRKAEFDFLDAPTTPGTPLQLTDSNPTPKRPRWVRRLRRNRAAQGKRGSNLALPIAALLVAVLAFAGGLYLSFQPNAAPQATNTPVQPSPMPSSITGDAPEGYEWTTVGDARFLVPQPWTELPAELFLELADSLLPSSEGRDAVRSFLDLQADIRLYGYLVDFTGATVMVEDSGIVLPDEALFQRLEQLMTYAGEQFAFNDAPQVRETHLGRTLYNTGSITLTGNVERVIRLEAYVIYQGTKLYTIGFSSLENNFEARRPIFDMIFNSLQIGEAPISVPNMPEGWKVVQGERTAFAVPEEFIVTTGASRSLVDASTTLIFGTSDAAENVNTLFNLMSFDAMAANLRGEDLFFSAAVYQENALSTDLEAAGTIVEGMFSIIAENEAVQYTTLSTRRELLPVGEVSVTDTQLIIPERPPLRNVYYLLLRDDGLSLYALAVTFLESEAERMLPLTEQIAQTFVIME